MVAIWLITCGDEFLMLIDTSFGDTHTFTHSHTHTHTHTFTHTRTHRPPDGSSSRYGSAAVAVPAAARSGGSDGARSVSAAVSAATAQRGGGGKEWRRW